MQNKTLGYRELFLLFSISLILFSFKWILSFNLFGSEDLTTKIIHDSSFSKEAFDSYTYFHYVKSLSDLDFISLYNRMLSTNYLISSPYGSIIIHTLLFKIIGASSFIVSEYIFVALFFIIFFLIFRTIGLSKNLSLLVSVILFVSPIILKDFNYFGITELKTFFGLIYGLRFPRPLVVNIYFYFFIYILLQSHLNKNFFSIKNLSIFSILLALTASSFFFFFINMFLTLFIYLLVEYKNKFFHKLKENILKIIYSIILFSILITPFVILMMNSNPDYMQRMGVYELDFDNKFFLINHYLSKILRLKLIIVYIFLISSFFLIKKFNNENLKYIKIFYILFFSSLLSPIIFILCSGKTAFLMHFNNMVVLSTGILIVILIIVNLKLLQPFFKFKFNNFSLLFLIVILTTFYFIQTHNVYMDRLNKNIRVDRDTIVKQLQKNSNLQTLNILTFDNRLMTWSILKGNIELFLVDGSFSQRSNIEIENDIISSFKLMKLTETDFKNFISNKKIGYRYNNPELKLFFWQKYTANSSYTFQDTKDFDKNLLDFIKKSSPYYIHQFALPNFEIKRLVDKFNSFDKKNIKLPEHIIIDENHVIFKNIDIKENYCLKYKGKNLNLYTVKELCS